MLEHIRDVKDPKEAWDSFASLFSRTNDARLQLLENEIGSVVQQEMTISQYFLRVKGICNEITQLDAESKITETRTRRIIVRGLRPEYKGFMVAIQGWPVQLSLLELEGLLSNQESLAKHMAGKPVKDSEEVLFAGREDKFKPRSKSWQRSSQEGEARTDPNPRKKLLCFNCGKPGHFARDCYAPRKKSGEGGQVPTNNAEVSNDSDDEWSAFVTIVEDSSDVEEWDGFETILMKEAARDTKGEEGMNKDADWTDFLEGTEKEWQDVLANYDDEEGSWSMAATLIDAVVSANIEGEESSYCANYSKDWVVDSGCSNHMTGDVGKFITKKQYTGKRVVVTVNNSKLPIAHVGDATCVQHSKGKEILLKDVYHIPSIKKSLLSVSQITNLGDWVVFGPKDVKVYKEVEIIGDPCMEGKKMDTIYEMTAQDAYVEKVKKNETADLWHSRLAHVGYTRLQVMMKKQLVRGLTNLEVRQDIVCAGCQFGKAHQLPYAQSNFEAKEPLELVHSDVFGKVKVPSIGGKTTY